MARRSFKTDEVFRLIRERIARGDYRGRPFPSERKLAGQLGVSHPTARKAVQQAVAEGILHRSDTGRVIIPSSESGGKSLQFALVCPAEASPWVLDWMKAVRVLADHRRALLRVYHFIDGDDPILTDALGGTHDLCFFIAPGTLNRVLEALIRKRRKQIIAIFSDLRRLGVACVDNSPVSGMDLLMDHLVGLGHRRIACVTCESVDMHERVQRYREACDRHALEAITLYEQSPPEWMSPARGYRFMTRELETRPMRATAYILTTVDPGLGALRACYEAGV